MLVELSDYAGSINLHMYHFMLFFRHTDQDLISANCPSVLLDVCTLNADTLDADVVDADM